MKNPWLWSANGLWSWCIAWRHLWKLSKLKTTNLQGRHKKIYNIHALNVFKICIYKYNVFFSLFLRLNCIPTLPTNSLLARSYNDINLIGLSYKARNCYIRDISVSFNNDSMWLLRTQNSMWIGVYFTRSLDNVSWDYEAIGTADFEPIEIYVRHGIDDITYTMRKDAFCLRLQTVSREDRTAIKSGRDCFLVQIEIQRQCPYWCQLTWGTG